MSLSERLHELAEAGTTRAAVTAAAPGWEPGIKYEPDGSRIVTLPPSPALADEESWAAAVRSLGADVPDGYRVRLVEAKYDPAAWTRSAQGEDAVTAAVWRYRFVVEVAPARIDVDDLLRSVKKRNRTVVPSTSEATMAWLVGDMQYGKVDGDGTAGTVQRFYDSLDRSVTRYKALRKKGQVGRALILVAGDCIEGHEASSPITRLDLTITEMIRVYRRTLADAVGAFADTGDEVHVAVVGGNHDDAKRAGKGPAFRYDDSWAIEGASQVADVMAAKGHDVNWTFPDKDRMHLTVDASGTRIGLLHGHQTRGKMEHWLAAKALSRDAIGTADVVCSGHFHHLRLEQYAQTTWMQTGALDGGSVWWENIGGLSAPPASVTFVTQGGKWNALEVV